MKANHHEIKVELYVDGVIKDRNFYYYTDRQRLEVEIESIIKFIEGEKSLNSTILSVSSFLSSLHYIIVASSREIKLNEKVSL